MSQPIKLKFRKLRKLACRHETVAETQMCDEVNGIFYVDACTDCGQEM